jgi:hypothetical protein
MTPTRPGDETGCGAEAHPRKTPELPQPVR